MKFLVDSQLPISMVRYLRTLGHSVTHVRDVAMASAEDASIWRRAAHEGEVVISKDEDFAVRRLLMTAGPQVVWVRVGNCSNRLLIARLQSAWPEIEGRLQAGDPLVEVL